MSMRSQPHQLNWNGHDFDSLNLIIDSINDMLGELYQQVATLATAPASTGSGSLPDPVTVAHGGTGAITAAAARTALGLAIGTNVEAQSGELDAVAALAATGLVARTAAATYAARTIAAGVGISLANGDGVAGNPTVTYAGQAVITSSDTGTVNNRVSVLTPITIDEWSGLADITVTGMAGGVSGDLYFFRNKGTKNAFFAHQSAGSTAGNKFFNAVTSGPTPVAPGGFLCYAYDGTNWVLVGHEQGDWVVTTFAAGDYTASTGTYTVASATTNQYKIEGRSMVWSIAISGTTSGTPVSVFIANPAGYTTVATNGVIYIGLNGSGGAEGGYYDTTTPKIRMQRFGNTPFGAGTVNVFVTAKIPIT